MFFLRFLTEPKVWLSVYISHVLYLNPFKPLLWKFEFELEILRGVFLMLLKSHMPKKKKIYFSIFIYYNYDSNSSFNLLFCVGLCNVIEKSYGKKNINYEIPYYANFSWKAPRNLWDVKMQADLKELS